METKEIIKLLQEIDFFDEANTDILLFLREKMQKVELEIQEKINRQVLFLDSIAIDLPEGEVFDISELY
jgi:hypothetical protein